MFDPETKGQIKLAILEKRLVEAGKLDAKDVPHVSAGSGTSEIWEVAAIGFGYLGVIALLLLAGGLGGLLIRQVMLFEVGGLKLYVPVGLSVACFVLGVAIWLYRDLRHSRWVAVLQIIVAVAAGVAAVVAAPEYVSKGVAIGAAAVAVADGIEKLAKSLKPLAASGGAPAN